MAKRSDPQNFYVPGPIEIAILTSILGKVGGDLSSKGAGAGIGSVYKFFSKDDVIAYQVLGCWFEGKHHVALQFLNVSPSGVYLEKLSVSTPANTDFRIADIPIAPSRPMGVSSSETTKTAWKTAGGFFPLHLLPMQSIDFMIQMDDDTSGRLQKASHVELTCDLTCADGAVKYKKLQPIKVALRKGGPAYQKQSN
jgi:hypothetical protein